MSNREKARELRTYEPIWKRIKQRERCTIHVIPQLVKRVKKGVTQEKWRDDGFKILNELEWLWLEFSYDPEKQELTLELKSKYGLEAPKA